MLYLKFYPRQHKCLNTIQKPVSFPLGDGLFHLFLLFLNNYFTPATLKSSRIKVVSTLNTFP